MLAVGEQLFGQMDAGAVRMSTGFGGGVGGTHEELCGALSGGVLLIGALHGRAAPGEEKTRCYEAVVRYRERFAETFGATICQRLRDRGYGSEVSPCSALAAEAARLLLETLATD